MTALLAAFAGILVCAGVLAIVSGLRRRPISTVRRAPATMTWARISRRPPGRAGRRRDVILIISLVLGVVVATTTGWIVALLAIPLLLVVLPSLLILPRARDVDLLEALDRWVRAMGAALTTGRSIPDAIRVSRRTVPEMLAEPLDLLVARMNNRWDTREALQQLADELDSPDADAVIAALMLASSRGSTGASATLHALADSLQTQLRARRMIEAERSKPYVVVRQVTAITLVVLAGTWIMSPGFFAAYGSPIGQLVLGLLVLLYVASLMLMRRKAAERRRDRILIGRTA